jgi:hypothetical protein
MLCCKLFHGLVLAFVGQSSKDATVALLTPWLGRVHPITTPLLPTAGCKWIDLGMMARQAPPAWRAGADRQAQAAINTGLKIGNPQGLAIRLILNE